MWQIQRITRAPHCANVVWPDLGKAALCGASPAFPLVEPIPETNPGSMRFTMSEVGSATAYRYRVTFAVLPILVLTMKETSIENGYEV